jgi:2-keto-4-pentenoate hydratase/2-oxohepta-3-ene-1,7-dioic acid hydratase in catechol pathway
MRIIRFIAADGRALHGEERPDGDATILTGSIAGGFQSTSLRIKVKKLLAPLAPADIICIGRNYMAPGATHAEDLDRARRARDDSTLEVFLKPSSSVQHPNDPIPIPHFDGIDAHLDCEGELAIVIGRETRNVPDDDALKFVFGYTIANDVTARHFQTTSGPGLWMRGKGFDSFCPLGPAIVTADEIPDPNSLGIRTLINGKVVREGNTGEMIRSVPQIIAALSRHMTLRSGAVILTGAPVAANPGRPLRKGDRVTIDIESIGALAHPIT